jgi:hypothetical protein
MLRTTPNSTFNRMAGQNPRAGFLDPLAMLA